MPSLLLRSIGIKYLNFVMHIHKLELAQRLALALAIKQQYKNTRCMLLWKLKTHSKKLVFFLNNYSSGNETDIWHQTMQFQQLKKRFKVV